MPFWRSYAHLVWATKDRQPFIPEYVEDRLYGQMIQKAAELDCYVYAVNSMPDHLHVVMTIPPKHSVAYVVKMLKGASAHFVNHIIRPEAFHFGWQRGYGYLTLGETQLGRAVGYVQKQKEHHSRNTTNIWLERDSELDEGPAYPEDLPDSSLLREAPVRYDAISDEFPF